MFTFSPQNKKINSWNYSNNPIQKFVNPWFLILRVVTWMIHDCFLFSDGCSWVSCLFWTVELSTVLQKNPPGPADSSVFQHILQIWTLSNSDCMILRSIFSHGGQLRDSNTTIKKGSNIHWCSRRTHDALRAGGWKLIEFEDQGKLYLICLPGNMQVSSVASEGQY